MSPKTVASGEHYRKNTGIGIQFYVCMNRWSKNGVPQRVFEALQIEGIIKIREEAVFLDSATVKVHPKGTGALKSGKQSIGHSRGGLTTKIHIVTAFDRSVVGFSLSGGEAHDLPEGIALLAQIKRQKEQIYILMDRSCDGYKVRSVAEEKGFIPVVPPKRKRKNPWEYDKECYKHRNKTERCFLRLKCFRRIFTLYDKLDVIFCGFIYFSMLTDAILM